LGIFPSNISVADIELLAANNSCFLHMFRRHFAVKYEDFIDVLYDDLDIAISELELNPQLHRDDDEDKLSAHIISQLKMAGYNASLGTTGGGNKDITVIGNNPSWSWIGEAKIYRNITNLHEGFLQLATRYRNVNPTKSCGSILAYILRPNAAKLMLEWMNEVEKTQMELGNFTKYSCLRRKRLAFYSIHDHVASGLPFEVRHIGISLYFQPLDKSGRSAKKYLQRNTGVDSGNSSS